MNGKHHSDLFALYCHRDRALKYPSKMLFHFSKRQRRIDTFAQLQRNPGGYVKICLLEPKTFPDGRSKKMIFSWLRDPRFEIDRGPGRADTEQSDLKLVSFVHGFHERVLGRLVETRGESRILQGMPFGDPRRSIVVLSSSSKSALLDPDRGPTTPTPSSPSFRDDCSVREVKSIDSSRVRRSYPHIPTLCRDTHFLYIV